jgi:hypothetical protein
MRTRPEGLILKEEKGGGEGGYSWRNNHEKVVHFATTCQLIYPLLSP